MRNLCLAAALLWVGGFLVGFSARGWWDRRTTEQTSQVQVLPQVRSRVVKTPIYLKPVPKEEEQP